MSEVDIDAGRAWSNEIAGILEASDFGIVCVTPENVQRPWLMFEAGALAKKFEVAKVVPYIFDAEKSVLTGNPLSRFQAKTTTKKETLELLKSVNNSTKKPLDDPRFEDAFEAFWPRLETDLAAMPELEGEAPAPPAVGDILESLYQDVQRIGQKLDDVHTSVIHASALQRIAGFTDPSGSNIAFGAFAAGLNGPTGSYGGSTDSEVRYIDTTKGPGSTFAAAPSPITGPTGPTGSARVGPQGR